MSESIDDAPIVEKPNLVDQWDRIIRTRLDLESSVPQEFTIVWNDPKDLLFLYRVMKDKHTPKYWVEMTETPTEKKPGLYQMVLKLTPKTENER